jgi:hypothetical protein
LVDEPGDLGFASATAWLVDDVATRHWLGLPAVAGTHAGFGWLAATLPGSGASWRPGARS